MAIDSGTTERRSRRTILAGAIGGVAGLIGSRFVSPDRANAAAGGPVIMGAANDAGTTNTALTTASTGTAMLVTQNGTGTALLGVASSGIAGFFTSSNGTGVSGVTAKDNQFGVYGANDAVTNGGGEAIRANGQQNHGLVATTANATAYAVKAINSAGGAIFGWSTTTGGNVGLHGQGDGDAGTGVYGLGSSDTGHNFGVFGQTFSANGYGVWSSGNAYVTGNLGVRGDLDVLGAITASTKDFRIDHPLDPAQRFLSHSCVESDERRTVYDGVVTTDASGAATVNLPAWFGALNRDVRYQLTVIGRWSEAWVSAEVKDNTFAIATKVPDTKVCWQLTGIRQDPYAKAHPLTVEAAKTGTERGRYLHPEVYGKPASKSIDALHQPPAPATTH